ncbi:MAG: CRP-like cAMP-binding protein [Vicingaceae bacterium]|jgi:CRP-like cAMP-binding protein
MKMSIDDSILAEVFKDISFSSEETTLIESKFEKIELTKGTILLRADETVLNQYYVQKGCLRTYYIDGTGKEHTLQFAINDWWISDYTAYFSSTKAIMNIECIQDATLYKISKKNIDGLIQETPRLETFFRKKMEKAFASFQRRILASLSQSAKERYITFRSSYPNIDQSIKNYHVASYLGITTESLSRIRKELTHS